MRKFISLFVLLFITLTLLGVVMAANTNSSDEKLRDTSGEVDVEDNNMGVSKNNSPGNVNKGFSDAGLDDESVGSGCSSTIIQGYNNDSALSFRRDATNKLTVNVKHYNSIVKQYKEGSYFFHVIVSKDGWMVGNGGADNAQVNHAIENNAISMINKNAITFENMNNVYREESRISLGHFVIKAPNGTYSLIIKNGGRTFKDSGILKPGDYLIVPNSAYYYRKNTLTDIRSEDSMIWSSRMITARDGFGVNRREIVTYYYKNNRVNSTVRIYASNDNGKYVGRRTGGLIDNFRTNDKYFSSSSIPVIDSSIHLDTVNFFIRKTKTNVSVQDLKVQDDKVELNVIVKDEFNGNVCTGKVIVKVDGKTLRNGDGSNVQVPVNNGRVKYNATLINLWNKKNHTYSVNYIGNQLYGASRSGNARIILENFFKLKTVHESYIFFGDKLTIKSNVTFNVNNRGVNGGRVFYKINGKTVLNSNNTTLLKRVVNGKAEYEYTFNNNYRAKKYTITTVYINGVYRREYNTTVHVQKIPISMVSEKVKHKSNVIYMSGKLVDKKGKLIKYSEYVTVKINGKTLKTNNTTRKFNINGGKVNFKFTIPKAYRNNKYNLTINIPERKQTLSFKKNYIIRV